MSAKYRVEAHTNPVFENGLYRVFAPNGDRIWQGQGSTAKELCYCMVRILNYRMNVYRLHKMKYAQLETFFAYRAAMQLQKSGQTLPEIVTVAIDAIIQARQAKTDESAAAGEPESE